MLKRCCDRCLRGTRAQRFKTANIYVQLEYIARVSDYNVFGDDIKRLEVPWGRAANLQLCAQMVISVEQLKLVKIKIHFINQL